VGGLRGGERAAAFAMCEEREVREEVREEARSGWGGQTLTLKCGATQHSATQAYAAAPLRMASH
jgi:hypothetical protein